MLKMDLAGQALYTAEQSRTLDHTAIEQFGIPGFTLMRRAGQAAFRLLLQHWSLQRKITVLAGTGNNAGDGFIVASLAKQYGLDVKVLLLGDVAKLRGDARLAYEEAVQSRVEIKAYIPEHSIFEGLIVDAMLGTGLGGEVRGDFAYAIEQINNSGLPVLALDIPSGLCSDTGVPLGAAVQADLTVTFIGIKRGLMTGQGPEYTGQLEFSDLEITAAVYDQVQSSLFISDSRIKEQLLPSRARDGHKGRYGHVLVIGGDYGMAGAAAMAAEAAARVGAGLVSVATRPEHVAALVARRPEVMVHGLNHGQELQALIEAASVLVLGPGLGASAWGQQMLQQVLNSDKPAVVDADALNMIASGQFPDLSRANWVLTPHPGEAARLLGQSVADIQADRFAAVTALQQKYQGVTVLKGSGSLIADVAQTQLCAVGNPGMASGGMGDVLSGVIGGLLAQGLSLFEAATLGVNFHAQAGDLASAGVGERGMLASDLMLPLRRLVNGDLEQ